MPATNLNVAIPPSLQQFVSGSGTYNVNQAFLVISANATVGATYTNNGITFTVNQTVSGAQVVYANGPGSPTNSGVLTKVTGTGDSTINFYNAVAPKWIRVKVTGGGSTGGTVAADPVVGSASSFSGTGITTITCNGGGTASTGIAPLGGTATGGDLNITGGDGNPGPNNASTSAGNGGASVYGGGGKGASASGGNTTGSNGNAPGSGGGGSTVGGARAGGAAGGSSEKIIQNPGISYSYTVGAGGTGVTNAGNGANGIVSVEEHFNI